MLNVNKPTPPDNKSIDKIELLKKAGVYKVPKRPATYVISYGDGENAIFYDSISNYIEPFNKNIWENADLFHEIDADLNFQIVRYDGE